MRLDDGLGVRVVEARQVELVEHRSQRLHRAAAQRQQLVVRLRAQHALEAPVALHDQVVVDVLGVEVGGAERVVVGRDRAEAGEQEVGAGEQQRQRVRGAADVGGRHQGVVSGARLEVVHHREQVLRDHLAHAVGHRPGDVDAVDPAVLGALGARGARHGQTACLEIEHRAALGGAHQALGSRPRGEAHLEPARGVARGQERLRPGRVVAVDEDLLRAIDRDRLCVRREAAHAELELQALLDCALRERARRGHLPSDEQRDGVERRVAQQRHRRLELAEAQRHGARRVRCEQERMIDAVGDVGLDRRRAAHAHLLHRREQLDGREESEHARELRRRHARREARDLPARRRDVDETARELDVVERHRLLGDSEVDAAARDELVEQVELGLGLAVELDDAAVLDAQRGLGVVRARERDQPERGVLGHEIVAADGPRRVELRAERGARAHGAYGSGREGGPWLVARAGNAAARRATNATSGARLCLSHPTGAG